MNIQKITIAKKILDDIKGENNLIKNYELPYENLLTRLDAAIFFYDLYENADKKKLDNLFQEKFIGVECNKNNDSKLSSMEYKLTMQDLSEPLSKT